MKTLSESHFTIIGTGLMGTSLAMALRGKVASLTGIDTLPSTLNSASLYFDDVTSDLNTLSDADVVVLAAPVRAILALVPQIGRFLRPGALMLDLGSVKTAICRAMDALPEHILAIGGHPMCGKELSGPDAAEPTLYQNCTFVLCPTARTSPEALAFATQMVHAIGANPLVLAPERHDLAVAAASHLPYMVSAGLVATLMRLFKETGDSALWQLTASGFRDTSRLAASDVTMMGDTVTTNRAAVVDVLDTYIEHLSLLRNQLADAEDSDLRAALESIRQTRHNWPILRSGG
jgi:prephenate dehydrogenase